LLDSIIRNLREARGVKEIPHGDKVIKIEVHFWTDDLISNKEMRIPKVAWDYGTLHILKNDGHGIERSDPIHFSSLSELTNTIENAFGERGVKLLHGKKSRPVYYP
jgi:hypothetical protein